jgi:hypothetical protein
MMSREGEKFRFLPALPPIKRGFLLCVYFFALTLTLSRRERGRFQSLPPILRKTGRYCSWFIGLRHYRLSAQRRAGCISSDLVQIPATAYNPLGQENPPNRRTPLSGTAYIREMRAARFGEGLLAGGSFRCIMKVRTTRSHGINRRCATASDDVARKLQVFGKATTRAAARRHSCYKSLTDEFRYHAAFGFGVMPRRPSGR